MPSDTDPVDTEPSQPAVRSETDLLGLTLQVGDTPLYRGPRIRLILPPIGPQTPGRRRRTRSLDGDPEIRATRRSTESTENVTAPFNKRFFIGIRWPGLSIGIHEPPYSLELKHLEDSPSDITITGIRLYHHAIPLQRANYYWGLDLSRIQFEGEVSEGEGTSTGVFFGFHRELAPYLSWSLDVGPYYIYLRDDSTDISANGLEYTVTTGLNFELW